MTNLLKTALLTGAAAMCLTACGADDVASPGEGVIVVPPPGGGGGGGGGNGGGQPTPGEAAANCPTGTANVGTIEVGGANSGDTRRICQLGGTITENLFLENLQGVIYSLSGKVQVGVDAGADANSPGGDPAILTIDAGVTIFGQSGADFLAVNRGSQLIVDGNANAPVVMTSRANVVGTATESSTGQWGGVVILGRAPIADCASGAQNGGTVNCEAPVEGTSGSVYGGAFANDNSGSIEYLQIRFAGFQVDTNNELNGLTLAGVGAGTTIDHVQVHNNSDDGIEWFGGTVNNYHLVLTGNEDEAIDYDSGYNGATQFVIIDNSSGRGDKLIEIDSSDKPSGNLPRTNVEISNMTAITPDSDKVINVRAGADLAIYNSVISIGGGLCIDIDGSDTVGANAGADDELGAPRFASFVLDCGTPAFADDNGGVTGAQIAALFAADANNDTSFSNTLTNRFVNGSAENNIVASAFADAGNETAFFDVDYIGAVENASDDWWSGWTCGLPGEASCLAIPAAG